MPDDTEIQLARIQERLDGLIREVRDGRADAKLENSEIHFTIKELEKRERERNDKMKEMIAKQAVHELRWAEHLSLSVQKIAELDTLSAQHRGEEIRRKVYQQWWVWLVTGATAAAAIIQAMNEAGIL